MGKTLKELESDNSAWRVVVIILIISFVVVSCLAFFSMGKSESFLQQLSECQDQVPVWTLRFVCIEEDIKVTFEQNFTEYEGYEIGLGLIGDKKFKLFENCEVIE